jgi:Ca2+-binding RTX toxin-like protein
VAGLDFSTLPDDYVQVFRSPNEDGGQSLTDAAAGVSLAEGEKLFGLFGASESDSGYSSDGNFEYFTPADDPSNPLMTRGNATYSVTSNGIESDDGIDPDPTLKEVALVTLDVLSQDPDGFFIMFEQGYIDWANHDNNFATMIGGVADLDAAVRAAEDFVGREGDGIDWSNTLMLVTADHSNSYMRNQVELGKGNLPTQVPAGGTSPYGSAWAYPNGEVTYRSGGHTNELVTLQARGAGAGLFAEHTLFGNAVDNTSIYQVMMDAAEATENPAKHIILFIGDGMNISHEVAGSRYLYGEDQALAWDDWGTEAVSNSWAGYATTWDVTTYNKYASANGLLPYDSSSFDPSGGYNPELGGTYPSQEESNVMQTVGSANSSVTLVGESSGDVLLGSSYAETLAGEMGNDIVVGGDGDDVLRGDRNSRDAGGTVGGDDLIYGGAGNDRLGGKSGNDQLFGEDGDDQLWGDDGDDLLWGGKGNDTLTGDNKSGGKGSDIFVLAAGENTDTITDFQKGIDKIGLYGNIGFSDLTMTGNQIKLGNEVLAILNKVDTESLGEDSFVTVTI